MNVSCRKFAIVLLCAVISLALRGKVWATAAADVSPGEISGYTQIYQLDIRESSQSDDLANDGFDGYSREVDGSFLPIPYNVDNSNLNGTISRIGYYMELQKSGGAREWVWASVDAFTQDLTMVGVPAVPTGANFQQLLDNMNVESNVSSIVTGTGITTGNIEFFPRNYSTTLAADLDLTIILVGDTSLYDYNDNQQSGGVYGSMQIHNYGAQQTLFGYSGWGGFAGGDFPFDDMGIGTNTTEPDARTGTVDGPDWTRTSNGDQFILKSLEVWAELEGGEVQGDYDGNGFVGQSDLDLVLLNWGDTSPPAPAGWVNGVPDGLIGQGALDGVLLNWGSGTPPISAIPEPTSALLALLAILATTSRNNRWTKKIRQLSPTRFPMNVPLDSARFRP